MLDRILGRNSLKITVRREEGLAAATFTTERKASGVRIDPNLSKDLGQTQNLGVELAFGRAGKLYLIAGESLNPAHRLKNPRPASVSEGIALIIGMIGSGDEDLIMQIPAARMALRKLCIRLPDSTIVKLRGKYSDVF